MIDHLRRCKVTSFNSMLPSSYHQNTSYQGWEVVVINTLSTTNKPGSSASEILVSGLNFIVNRISRRTHFHFESGDGFRLSISIFFQHEERFFNRHELVQYTARQRWKRWSTFHLLESNWRSTNRWREVSKAYSLQTERHWSPMSHSTRSSSEPARKRRESDQSRAKERLCTAWYDGI
jgi:hypothetical protein